MAIGGAAAPVVSSPSTPGTDGGVNPLPKNIDELRAKRRGVKPGSTRGSYRKANGEPRAAAEPVAPPAPMFTPESMRPLVSLPFDIAFVKTGYTGFPLTDVEASTLSNTGAMVFNEWVQIDPKWVAIITFSLSLASITTTKVIGYKKALIEHQAEQERLKKEKENPASTPVAGAGPGNLP